MTERDLIIAEGQMVDPRSVVIVGLPWDGGSSYLEGAAQAPGNIRRALRSAAGNPYSESGVCLNTNSKCRILDDLDVDSSTDCLSAFEEYARQILHQDVYPIFLGGDHSITRATIRPFEARFPDLTLIQFDAHPDLYPDFDDNPYSHACVMARILERGALKRLIQIGIRADTPEQTRMAHRFGVEQIPPRRCEALDWSEIELSQPLYLSIDLDVLDPAFAPGVSHPEPGGLSTRQLVSLIQQLPANVVGADLVELNPSRDLNDLSAGVAAKIVKEVASKMLEANPS